ncbi:phosphoenolpyruvate synthase [Bacillus solimangrovi]|uniref:Phosphoenolpyruvate synthase n=1 Tax=Bacillus solimangrovi TaxID=1305675 RepID=A0A1E5LD67_9BACI|nr:phosphoenolpyruvate synthase [Bacillus solimangrovi]OEH92025.1 phosphoenolpyruvate synthase [Bacillus solimangrovi]
MKSTVLYFEELDQSSLAYVGGKGANLGEMTKAGFPVPRGFCITTLAFKEFISRSNEMNELLNELKALNIDDLQQLRKIGKRLREHMEQIELPLQIHKEIIEAWKRTGEDYCYAVRSSATAEDLPMASFAGQQDTYLNIYGETELLYYVRKCWASLFTDRAIAYRVKNKFSHDQVYLSVVVQRMVKPEMSGIMFTADPITGDRNVVSIDASFGLGEAIVSGIVSADLYKVKSGEIISKSLSEKKIAIMPLLNGGTETKELPVEKQKQQALSDQTILEAAKLGKEIENHYGSPQDIEFCVEDEDIFIVQSRPITSLYPLPDLPQQPLRVLISFGHIQMMTDAMKPLGISVLRTIFPKQMFLESGGRLFIDPTLFLQTKIGRKVFPKVLNNMDESISWAIEEFIQRPDFLKNSTTKKSMRPLFRQLRPIFKEVILKIFRQDPSLAKGHVEAVIENIAMTVRKDLKHKSGVPRLEAVNSHLEQMVGHISKIMANPMALIIAARVLQKMLYRLTGSDYEFNELTKSLPGNIMSEMGLEMGELADLLRELPEVEEYLKTAEDESFYEGLLVVKGGELFKKSLEVFIGKYGMRCAGEIDITRPRWRENPTLIVATILANKRNLKPNEHRAKFEQGLKEVEEAKHRIFEQIGSSGRNKIKQKYIARLIEVYRYMSGLREHHKHLITIVLDECKQALLIEANEMVDKGILQQVEDIYFLTLEEIIEMAKGTFKYNVMTLIKERKNQYAWHQTLIQPRVMTSEGEMITRTIRKGNFPAQALIGSPVSAGVVEGRARIVYKPEEANLNQGEILIANHTDPGWTPLFQTAIALVTEVGGLMTHGSVVAREYGIPAVFGVDDAMTKIKEGQWIRVDGNQGFVEIITDEE